MPRSRPFLTKACRLVHIAVENELVNSDGNNGSFAVATGAISPEFSAISTEDFRLSSGPPQGRVRMVRLLVSRSAPADWVASRIGNFAALHWACFNGDFGPRSESSPSVADRDRLFDQRILIDP